MQNKYANFIPNCAVTPRAHPQRDNGVTCNDRAEDGEELEGKGAGGGGLALHTLGAGAASPEAPLFAPRSTGPADGKSNEILRSVYTNMR